MTDNPERRGGQTLAFSQEMASDVAAALDELNAVSDAFAPAVPGRDTAALTTAMRTTLNLLAAVASTSVGECHVDDPVAGLQPIMYRDADGNIGLKWCCTHPTQHCVP